MVEPTFWTSRRRRAERLVDTRPHAAELLAFYLTVLDHQEPVSTWARQAAWAQNVDRTGQSPSLDLSRIPPDDLEPRFEAFVRSIGAGGNEVIRNAADRLLSTASMGRRVIEEFLDTTHCDQAAAELELEPMLVEMFPHAMLQSVAHAVSGDGDSAAASWQGSTCPRCGWPPVAAQIRDEEGALGRRRLVCALCLHAWTFPRTTCPRCGETGSDRLGFHVDDQVPYVRVEECTTCNTYLKAFDLRERGDAIPEVDDIATLELDLWARQKGLERAGRGMLF